MGERETAVVEIKELKWTKAKRRLTISIFHLLNFSSEISYTWRFRSNTPSFRLFWLFQQARQGFGALSYLISKRIFARFYDDQLPISCHQSKLKKRRVNMIHSLVNVLTSKNRFFQLLYKIEHQNSLNRCSIKSKISAEYIYSVSCNNSLSSWKQRSEVFSVPKEHHDCTWRKFSQVYTFNLSHGKFPKALRSFPVRKKLHFGKKSLIPLQRYIWKVMYMYNTIIFAKNIHFERLWMT